MNLSFIALLAGAQGILFSLTLIITGIQKKKAHLFLGILLAVCSIELINAGVMPLGYHRQSNAVPFWILGSYLLAPPALGIFLQANSTPGYSITRRSWLFFLPAVAEIMTEAIVFYVRRSTGANILFTQSTGWFLFTEVLPLCWTLAVLIRHWIRLQQMPKTPIPANRLQHIKQNTFLIGFTVLSLLWAADSLLHFQVYPVIEALLCGMLFTLGYIIYFIPAFFETPAVIATKASVPAFTQYNDLQQWQRLLHLFEVDKRHRQPRLTLEEVAAELGLPARYVSGLIHQQGQNNFASFVNTWRVQDVLERIKDPREQHKTLLGIALDAGFNSKSSFNHIFKTVTGKTPSAYLEKKQ